MQKAKNVKISNISRGSIYKIYRENTKKVRENENVKKKQLVFREIKTH